MTYKDGLSILKNALHYTINSDRGYSIIHPFSFLYIAHAYYEGWLDDGNRRANWKVVLDNPNSYDPIHNDYEVIPVKDPFQNLSDFYRDKKNLLTLYHIFDGLSSVLALFDKKRQLFLDIYNQLSTLNISWWEENWPTAFDDLLFYILESQERFSGEHTQPVEITQLIHILEKCYCGANSKKYDPFAGLGFFLDKGSYGGEINGTICSLGNLRMMVHGYQFQDYRDYVKVDSTKYWGNGISDFDSIISFPPINMRIPYDKAMNIGDYGKSISVEEFFILKGLQSLNAGGHIIGVFSNSILFAEGTRKNLRKELVLNGRVQMVIQLPANLLYGSSIPTCIVVISKDGKNQNDTIFVDTSQLYTKDHNKNVLKTNEVIGVILSTIDSNTVRDNNLVAILKENLDYSISSNDLNKFVIKVSNDTIAKNNYNLSPSRYFIHDIIDIPEGYSYRKLGELAQITANKQTRLDQIRLIRGGDLSVSDNIEYRTFEDLPLESNDGKGFLLTKDAIIVQKIRNLKPTLYRHKEGVRVAISSNLYAIIPNDIIDPYYLVSELKKPYVTEQVYNLSQGAVMPSLHIHDLANIRILIPGDRETQHTVFLKAQKQDVTELIQRERERISEMMRINRHRINPYISGLQSNVSMLLDEIKATGKLEPDCLLSRDYTILDALENMKENLKHIKSLFDEFTIDKNIGVIESFDLIHFLKDYSYNQTMPDKHFVLDKSQLNTKEKYPLILFNKANLGEVLEEIIHNAEKHLITGAKENRIAFVPRFDGKNVSLLICNNGEPLPADFDEERSFAPGYHKDEKGTGLGLYRVRKVCSEFGANIKWDNDPDNFMPTGLCITFKLS